MADHSPSVEGPWSVSAGTPGNQRFGSLLRNLREESGLTPKQLADRAGVHVSFVRGIERGAQAPSMATARPMLAVWEQQGEVEWKNDAPFDLIMRDPKTGHDVAFEFKAKVKGQNRRTEIEASNVAHGLSVLAEAMSLVRQQIASGWQGVEDGQGAIEGQPRIPPPVPQDDATLGRVVRLLAAADQVMLQRVESLLLSELSSERLRGEDRR